jgi:hypothetical protein
MTKRARSRFWHANSYQEGVQALGAQRDNPFVDLSIAGLTCPEYQGALREMDTFPPAVSLSHGAHLRPHKHAGLPGHGDRRTAMGGGEGLS